MSNALVVGVGNVGSRLMEELKVLEPDGYDPEKGINDKKETRCEIAFICVDTPLDGMELDVTSVTCVVMETDAKFIVIKSTVPVGYTEMLKSMTGKHIVFSPEYYGTTQHANDFDFNFTVLGGDEYDCMCVQNILQRVYNGTHRFIHSTFEEAEIAKLMENAWIATKVDFCIGFQEACQERGISYDKVREIFISDPRVSPCHTFVYKDHPYWHSHCLDKDVPHAATQLGIEQLRQLCKRNEHRHDIYGC